MANPPANSGIRDNHYCGSVGDFLKPHMQEDSKLSVVSAYFTIYAYAALKDWLDHTGGVRPSCLAPPESFRTQTREE